MKKPDKDLPGVYEDCQDGLSELVAFVFNLDVEFTAESSARSSSKISSITSEWRAGLGLLASPTRDHQYQHPHETLVARTTIEDAVQGGPEGSLALGQPEGGHDVRGNAVQGEPERGLALLKPEGGHDIPIPLQEIRHKINLNTKADERETQR